MAEQIIREGMPDVMVAGRRLLGGVGNLGCYENRSLAQGEDNGHALGLFPEREAAAWKSNRKQPVRQAGTGVCRQVLKIPHRHGKHERGLPSKRWEWCKNPP